MITVMGIFSKLFASKRTTKHEPQPDSTPSIEHFDRSMLKDAALQRVQASDVPVPAEREYTVFAYAGTPLKAVPRGTMFTAEIVYRRVKLTSTLTGTEWDSEKEGGLALAYAGTPFGFIGDRRLCDWIRHKGARHIDARWSKWYDRGIPEVVVYGPNITAVSQREERELKKAAGDAMYDIEYAQFTITAPNDGLHRFLSGKRSRKLLVKTEIIPPRAGSSAKPHIGVYADADLVLEIDARKPAYFKLSDHVGEKTRMVVTDEGGFFSVTMVFL